MGGFFSVENPELSWLWLLPGMLMLADLEGVHFARILFKQFAVPYFKPTLMLHNTPTVHRLRSRGAPWVGDTLVLRGKMWWDGRLQFRTHVAQPYPPVLGVAYAKLIQEALHTRAAALEGGLPCPMALENEAATPSLSLQQAAWISDSSDGAWTQVAQLAPVCEDLVPDGMRARRRLSPLEHVEWGNPVARPAAAPPANATAELKAALAYEGEADSEDIDKERRRTLYGYIKLSSNMKDKHATWSTRGTHMSTRPRVQKIHGPLFEQCLQEASDSNDDFALLIKHCRSGFPFVGDLPPCTGSSV